MDEYYQKYAKPLGKLSMFDLSTNLNNWRDHLKDELEGILYLRNGLNISNPGININSNRIDSNSKNKLIDIINKLECLVLKEIECISEFLIELERSKQYEIDDKIYNKTEFIRENYNKILLNIQKNLNLKLTSSSPDLIESREKYEKNKNSITETLYSFKPTNDYNTNKRDNSNKKEFKNYISNFGSEKEKMEQGREWLDKLNKDLDDIDRDTTKANPKMINETSRIDRSITLKDNYSVDKDISKLERQFHNLQKIAEDSNYHIKDLEITNLSRDNPGRKTPQNQSSLASQDTSTNKKSLNDKKTNKSKSIQRTNSSISNLNKTSTSKLKKPNNQNPKSNNPISNLKPNTTKNSINFTSNNAHNINNEKEKENLNIDISNISHSYLKEKNEFYADNLNNTAGGRMSYNHIKNFTEELERVKNFCKEIKKSQQENCIMENEKRTFDKMKNEYIKLSADMNIMKEDIKEILTNYHSVIKRVNFLEEENKNLRKHNKNLVKLIQNRSVNNPNSVGNLCNINDFGYENYAEPQGNFIGDYTESINRVQSKHFIANAPYNNTGPIRQTPNNATNYNSNLNDHISNINNENYFLNTLPNNLNNQMNIDNNFSTPLSDLSAFNNINNTSSNELIGNINNNISNLDNKKSKKRFLIQKDNLDYNENFPLQSQLTNNVNRDVNSNIIKNNLGNIGNNSNPGSFHQSGLSNRNYDNTNKNEFDMIDYGHDNISKNICNNYDDQIPNQYLSNTNIRTNNFQNNKHQMINNYN